jgi:hypothetical protein
MLAHDVRDVSPGVLGTFTIGDVDDDLGPYLFLRAHAGRGDQHLVRRHLKRCVPRSVLPERARLLRSIDAGDCYDVLAEVDDVLVLLRTWRAAADVWATAPLEASALAVVEEIRSRIPERVLDRRVEVRFTDADTGTRHLEIDVRPWAEVRALYAGAVRTALDELVPHVPTVDEARRLLLWHGQPGTGKTSAIRALLYAWRGWADGIVVTDPDALVDSGKYLRRTVLDNDEGERWQVLVLEDAESLLHKGSGGKGMAKLLNLADGMLGQGLRCLFLITTNEPLGAVHPALVRPGRCLANIEFTALPASQSAGLLGRPVDRAMTVADVMATGPLLTAREPVAVGQYL